MGHSTTSPCPIVSGIHRGTLWLAEAGADDALENRSPLVRLVLFSPGFFAAALAGQCCLGPLFFPGLQIVAVFLDFLDDVFLLHFSLKTAQRVFQGFTFLDNDFRQ